LNEKDQIIKKNEEDKKMIESIFLILTNVIVDLKKELVEKERDFNATKNKINTRKERGIKSSNSSQ
jgi:uncharacterized protein (UPF0305 family)